MGFYPSWNCQPYAHYYTSVGQEQAWVVFGIHLKPPKGRLQEGSLKLGREQQNFSIGSEVKYNRVMRRNTELNGDFSRHNAFLLPFLHMGKSHAGFQLQTVRNSSCYSAVTSQGSTPQG